MSVRIEFLSERNLPALIARKVPNRVSLLLRKQNVSVSSPDKIRAGTGGRGDGRVDITAGGSCEPSRTAKDNRRYLASRRTSIRGAIGERAAIGSLTARA